MNVFFRKYFLFLLLSSYIYSKESRFNDFGNFKNTTYFQLEEKKNKRKKVKDPLILEDFIEMNEIFDGLFRGMSFIKGTKNFNIGTVQKNLFYNKKVDVDDFFIDKTVITVKEYKKFLDILKQYLIKKRENIFFILTDDDIRDKYLKNDNNVEDESFKKNVEWYISFRNELKEKLTPEYIDTMEIDFSVLGDEVFVKKYFGDKNYENYPIVGIYFNQLIEFCKWRTFYANEYYLRKTTRNKRCFIVFDIPTYSQFVYAASCGNEQQMYPWGTVNVRDKNGKTKANLSYGQYKNGDIGLQSVYEYAPNKFGLYDMSGNVFEWLNDNDMNYFSPTKENINKNERMITGGSWVSCINDLEIGKYRNVHVLDTYYDLGFRCIANIIR